MLTQDSQKYDSENIQHYFDEFGQREWDRLTATPVDEVSLHIHTHYLKKHIPAGARVLEIGAGAGRFTQALAHIGAKITIADISRVQLDLNKKFAQELNYTGSIHEWVQADICDLDKFSDGSYPYIVVYGGPLSYVLDQRDKALQECIRVLEPGGILAISVMSLWGTAHRTLREVMRIPAKANRKIIRTGDLTPATFPGRKTGFMHLFRSEELIGWLENAGLTVLDISASNCISTGWQDALADIRANESKWSELLQIELQSCAEPGCLDMGTHMIAITRKG